MRSCYYRTHSITYFWKRVFYLEKSVLSRVIFHLKLLFFCMTFQACKYQLKYCISIPVCTSYMICLTRYGMLGMWYAREVTYWACGMFETWGCWGCGIFGMWVVPDVGCWECWLFKVRMFGMWDVLDVGCFGCGMFGMWDIQDVWCWFTKYPFSWF